MRNAGRIGVAVALAVALFLLGGVGLLHGLHSSGPSGGPVADRLDAGSFSSAVVERGSLEQSIASLQAHLRSAGTDWRGFASLGLAYVQEARVTADPTYYPKAEEALQRSLFLETKDNDVAAVGMAALDAARHDFAGALTWGNRARSVDPYDANAYGAVGDAEIELGRYDEAIRSFQRMIDLRPDLASWARVSYARELLGDVPGAIRAMERAKVYAASPGDQGWAGYHLGELFFSQGEISRAAAEYREGARLAPDYVPLRAGLAKVAWARDDIDRAIHRYREVVASYPLPEYVIALGDLYRLRGETDLAAREDGLLRTEERLLRASGVNVDLEQALFDSSHGRPSAGLDAARSEWHRRHSVQVADALSWALHETGRDEKALRYSRMAMRLGTRNALFAFHAGMIRLSLGEIGAARTLLEEARSINPWFSIQYAPVLERMLARLGGGR
jgi:tetratricopeptide (TPR) repeat protein